MLCGKMEQKREGFTMRELLGDWDVSDESDHLKGSCRKKKKLYRFLAVLDRWKHLSLKGVCLDPFGIHFHLLNAYRTRRISRDSPVGSSCCAGCFGCRLAIEHPCRLVHGNPPSHLRSSAGGAQTRPVPDMLWVPLRWRSAPNSPLRLAS